MAHANGNREGSATFCHILAVPYPARGHINPMMNLCRSLVSKKPDILVTFVVTEEWFGLIGSDQKPDNIRFGTIPNDLTSELARSGDYSPDFLEEVLRKMEAPVDCLIDQLHPLVSTIIYDSYLVFGVRIGNRRNIPAASFWTMPALVYSVFDHLDLLVQHHHFPITLKEQGEERIDYIPGVSSIRIADLPTCLYGKGLSVLNRGLEAVSCVSKAQYLLLVSVYELESEIIDALRGKLSIPIYHIGFPIPYFKQLEDYNIPSATNDHLQWLDSQPKGSVLYVSQGSLHSASKAQLEEIEAGLRLSRVRYFWVARKEASRFKDSCGEKGLVVPWCDQLRVLCHPSIGGFWSHCGWNSTSEAIFCGVPMLTFPIYWDQTSNSKQIVEDWEIGWRANGKMGEDGLIPREEIAELIQKFMDSEKEEVKELRRRAKELSKICRGTIENGGSSETDLEAFLNDIFQSQRN
ncbi:hypothetical protein SLEP1_g30805 [Rubroshorea leprosula]|uniref:Uncharacterized protein n=1 Tax=Rubroshorea leprosula TaxID=152421 RepID=A0AAV5K1D5_9ROSI|nr:hypothetical protein SLEP1_g30805 [Rubroshorea leprosula]